MGFLNRKMRRELVKRGGPEKLLADVHQVIEDEVHHNTAMTDMVLTLWVLHDKFGFGNERIRRFMDELGELATVAGDKKLISNPLDIREQLYAEVPVTRGKFPLWNETEKVKESMKATRGYIS